MRIKVVLQVHHTYDEQFEYYDVSEFSRVLLMESI